MSRFERRSSSRASPLRNFTDRNELGEFDDALFVGATVDEDPSLVEHLFDRDHFTLAVGVAHADDGEGLVQHDLVAAGDLGRGRGRGAVPRASFARGEDVDGAVVVEAREGAVDRRRLGQFLDLVTQRRDLVTRLLNRDGQLLVVRSALGQLAPRLEQLLFEYLDAPAGLLDVAQGCVVAEASATIGRRARDPRD